MLFLINYTKRLDDYITSIFYYNHEQLLYCTAAIKGTYYDFHLNINYKLDTGFFPHNHI